MGEGKLQAAASRRRGAIVDLLTATFRSFGQLFGRHSFRLRGSNAGLLQAFSCAFYVG
jgi:hypothetical protein